MASAHARSIALLTAAALGGCIFGTRRAATPAADRSPRWTQIAAPADGGVALAPRGRCPTSALPIPGGTFAMGSPAGQGSEDEHPQHPVTLRAYCLDRTEVTVDAYTACVRAGACTRPAALPPAGDQPASGIDWQQAQAYCRFVGGRLPTEAEWEFAARGTDGRRWPWGSEEPSACSTLDWTHGPESCGGVGPSAVGTHPAGASPFGVEDMAGNVWEWTADWYARAYAPGAQVDPTGPAEGSARVTRGGGFNNDQPERLGATYREGQHPAFHDYDLGVRCAFEPAS